jgi:outer membrane usher protein
MFPRAGRPLHFIRVHPLALGVLGMFGATLCPSIASAAASTAMFEPAAASFDPSFFGASGASNLPRFERGNPVLPGEYGVDLYVNDRRVGRERVTFNESLSGGNAQACLTEDVLGRAGLDIDRLATGASGDHGCLDLSGALPEANVTFDVNALRLDLTLPQASMRRQARGFVDPRHWDAGINAATVGYRINAYRTEPEKGEARSNTYLGLDNGLNIAGWRFRQRASMRWERGRSQWQNIGAYAEHDITPWQAQLTLGDSFTSGELFDSFAFRGARMASDDRMRPAALSGYAPVVRGIAESNARVEIRQNGMLIQETTVSPGPFVIDDLYATGYGGDLEVTVIEANGRRHGFALPYAAVPQLLRPGQSRYAATLGQIRQDGIAGTSPWVAEVTYQRGLSNALTAYTGGQGAAHGAYRSALIGSAINTPVGALSMDITTSRTRSIGGDTRSGQSLRMAYSKALSGSGTNVSLAAYRFSSAGFLGLNDAMTYRGQRDQAVSVPDRDRWRQRSRFQVTLSQAMSVRGDTLTLTGSSSDYWGSGGRQSSYQLGYGFRWSDATISLAASRSQVGDDRESNSYSVTFSIPLGVDNGRRPTLQLSADRYDKDRAMRATVSGSRDSLGYGASAARNSAGDTELSANMSYRTPYAVLGGAYSRGRQTQQASLNTSGGLVLHGGGITLAQSMSETIGLIEARGATGARIGYQARVDHRGYAVATGLTPYRYNSVSLDPKGTSMDVELQSTRQQVAPRAGAVVAVRYDTVVGRAVIINARRDDGAPIPFGAQVLDERGNAVGVVAQGSRLFLRGIEDVGSLRVQWGEQDNERCMLDYTVHPARGSGLIMGDALCQFLAVRSSNADDVLPTPFRGLPMEKNRGPGDHQWSE